MYLFYLLNSLCGLTLFTFIKHMLQDCAKLKVFIISFSICPKAKVSDLWHPDTSGPEYPIVSSKLVLNTTY